jgi:hypothetical protein
MNGKALALCARRSQMGTNPCLSMSFATSSGDAPRRRGNVEKQDVIPTLEIAVLECKPELRRPHSFTRRSAAASLRPSTRMITTRRSYCSVALLLSWAMRQVKI